MSEIREGYKQTKVGVIPEEWKVVKVNDVFDFIKTYSNSRADLSSQGDIEYLHYGDIHTKYKYHLDFNLNSLPKISSKKIKGDIEYVKDGDIFIADASEDYADIGKSVEAININNKKIISGLHTFLLRDKDNNFVSKYKGFIFYNENISKSIKKIATGISVLGISKTNLGKLQIPLPPIKEQQKIAQILSTWDDAISKQEQLIVVKERVKKGLMQRLLNGELRIDNGEWEEVRLKEVVNCFDNKRVPLNKQERQKIQGNIPYYGSTSVVDHINDYIFDEDIVLVSEDGGYFYEFETRPIAFYVTGKSWVNNHVHIIKNKNDSLNLKFLYYSLVHKNITAFLNGGTRAKLNKKDLLLLKIKLPPLEEQQKIAQFLSTADKEIELLKKELEVLKKQKKGLMQRLLSGEVRVKIAA